MNENPPKKINLAQARVIAESLAVEAFRYLDWDKKNSVLEPYYLGSEFCWIFFPRANIEVPPEQFLRAKVAFAISIFGDISTIADFRKQPEILFEYVLKMSDYYGRVHGVL
jgi:hypothetical protein